MTMRVSPCFASKLTLRNQIKYTERVRWNTQQRCVSWHSYMVVVSGYWYMGVCVRVLISRVRQVKDKSVCIRSEEERYVHVFYMTASVLPK